MKRLILLSLLVACSNCADAKPAPIAAESAYTAELLRCVDKATTLAESKSCRKNVDSAFGVDGGAK